MKELLEKLTKQTEETNAALQVNSALSKETNASLKVQSHFAQAQEKTLKSLVNITKAGLLGGEREKLAGKLQDGTKQKIEAERIARERDSDEKSFNLRDKVKDMQEKGLGISRASLRLLRWNKFHELWRNRGQKAARKILDNRSKLLTQSITDIRRSLTSAGETNLELLKAYKDPTEKGLLRKSAEGIASLVKFSKDGETRSPTLKLIKYFKDKDKREKIAAKERAQEGSRSAGDKYRAGHDRIFSKKEGFWGKIWGSLKAGVTALGGWIVAFGGVLGRLLKFVGPKALSSLKSLSKRFFVFGAVIAAFDAIKDAIKVFSSTEGGGWEKFFEALGAFGKTFVADIVGGTIDFLKNIVVWLVELFGGGGEVTEAIKNWSAIDAVKELFDGVVNALTKLVVGFAGEMIDGATMFGFDSNWFEATIGVILGAFKGILIGLVDGVAELLGSIFTAFNFVGDAEWGTAFKDFSMKDWLEGTVRPFILGIPDAISEFMGDIWNGVTGFFKNMFEKSVAAAIDGIVALISLGDWINGFVGDIWNSVTSSFKNMFEKSKEGVINGIMALISLGDWIMGFVGDMWSGITDSFYSALEKGKELMSGVTKKLIGIGAALITAVKGMLPDPKSWLGGLLAATGIYEKLDGIAKSPARDNISVDNTAIIPPKVGVGEALKQAGRKAGQLIYNVVNNNGGNVSNSTTSSQVNNTRRSSPIMMGSMGAY